MVIQAARLLSTAHSKLCLYGSNQGLHQQGRHFHPTSLNMMPSPHQKVREIFYDDARGVGFTHGKSSSQ